MLSTDKEKQNAALILADKMLHYQFQTSVSKSPLKFPPSPPQALNQKIIFFPEVLLSTFNFKQMLKSH